MNVSWDNLAKSPTSQLVKGRRDLTPSATRCAYCLVRVYDVVLRITPYQSLLGWKYSPSMRPPVAYKTGRLAQPSHWDLECWDRGSLESLVALSAVVPRSAEPHHVGKIQLCQSKACNSWNLMNSFWKWGCLCMNYSRDPKLTQRLILARTLLDLAGNSARNSCRFFGVFLLSGARPIYPQPYQLNTRMETQIRMRWGIAKANKSTPLGKNHFLETRHNHCSSFSI